MMSSLSQSSWLCSLHTTKTIQPSILIIPFHPQIKSLKFSSFTVSNSNDQSSLTPISSNESEQTLEESKPNRVKLALEKAREYKKSLQLDDNQEISNDPVAESAGIVSGSGGLVSGDESGDVKEVPEAVRIAMEKAREYQNNKENVGDVKSKVENVNSPGEDDGAEKAIPEVVRRAMEKAKEYKENKGVMSNVENENPPGDMKGGDMEVPEAVRIAMGKANEYKKNKGVIDNSSSIVEDSKLIGSEGGNASNMGSRNIEQNTEKKGDLKISSIDFVGLNFSDKKTGRALPAGLVPVSNPFPDDDLPEVEILVGDASKFGEAASSESKTPSQEEGSDLYKPKISTWGMFPRPNNISKTFGGGRNIRPGEALETPEDKAAKQARTRQLIAAYKRKMGLNIDPKLKAECEKALKNGDSLMDVGKLKEALPFYQTVMDKLAFQTELYGLAALQWSICEDSLSRSENARAMYEKLQSHPNAEVSKKARQFMFSFQAMEMMKVTRSTGKPKNTGYQSYFEAFVEDKPNYTSESTEEKEDAFDQALLYIVFLASPILLVLLYVAIKQV